MPRSSSDWEGEGGGKEPEFSFKGAHNIYAFINNMFLN